MAAPAKSEIMKGDKLGKQGGTGSQFPQSGTHPLRSKNPYSFQLSGEKGLGNPRFGAIPNEHRVPSVDGTGRQHKSFEWYHHGRTSSIRSHIHTGATMSYLSGTQHRRHLHTCFINDQSLDINPSPQASSLHFKHRSGRKERSASPEIPASGPSTSPERLTTRQRPGDWDTTPKTCHSTPTNQRNLPQMLA